MGNNDLPELWNANLQCGTMPLSLMGHLCTLRNLWIKVFIVPSMRSKRNGERENSIVRA